VSCPDLSKLEEYGYGEACAEIEEHLRGCASCRELLAAMRGEEQLYTRYARSVRDQLEVPPLVWQRVRSRIAEPPPSRRWFGLHGRALGYAASFVVAAAVVLGVVQTLRRTEEPRGAAVEPRPAPAAAPIRTREPVEAPPAQAAAPLRPAAATPAASIQRAEQDYLKAIDLLRSALDERRARLDPAVRSSLDRNLSIVDESIAATRKVYLAHPSDVELAEYLLAAYARKIEVLQDVAL